MSEKSNRWAVGVFGNSTVDLRGVVSDGEAIEVSAVAVFGDVHVIVAPGSRVEMSGVALFGDKRSELTVAASPTGPVVKVKALAMLGDVKVR